MSAALWTSAALCLAGAGWLGYRVVAARYAVAEPDAAPGVLDLIRAHDVTYVQRFWPGRGRYRCDRLAATIDRAVMRRLFAAGTVERPTRTWGALWWTLRPMERP